MLALKSMDVRDNFKDICQKVVNGETVLVSRPKNQNIYMVSEKEYNNLVKEKNNREYIAMLENSIKQLSQGQVVVKTMKELEEMANE